MENPEEILHSLEEFSKSRPKDIPRELEEYLLFVAKTGNPVYQWSAIKSLFKEKMVSVITEFYEACPSVDIPPCPNVDLFNYDIMKNFILEKLDTFASAPFTVQRISELLTTPRKEYNRIDKYMRALEKNILVVSTVEPGGRRTTENGEGIMNGLESEHLPETSNSSNDINVEEMDETPSWPRVLQNEISFPSNDQETTQIVQETIVTASKISEIACSSTQDTVITCRSIEETYVSIEPVPSNTCPRQENLEESDVSVTITAIPAGVQKRRNSVEPVVSSEETPQEPACSSDDMDDDKTEALAKEEPKSEDIGEETSSSQQEQEIKDADSSSNPEEDNENEVEAKKEPTLVVEVAEAQESLASIPDEDEIVTTNHEEANMEEPTSAIVSQCSELVDTLGKGDEEEIKSEAEISSSDKVLGEVTALNEDLLDCTDEAEAKVDLNEAKSLESDVVKEESRPLVEEEPISQSDDTQESASMEVDEEDNFTPTETDSKNGDVVKAEATSDSSL